MLGLHIGYLTTVTDNPARVERAAEIATEEEEGLLPQAWNEAGEAAPTEQARKLALNTLLRLVGPKLSRLATRNVESHGCLTHAYWRGCAICHAPARIRTGIPALGEPCPVC